MKRTSTRSEGRRLASLDWRAALSSASARRIAFFLFMGLAALTGGGSRADIVSLIVLRPLAVLFAAYALLTMPAGALAPARFALGLLAAAAVVVALHLVPLPPEWWQSLPGRGPVAALDAELDQGDLWRPLSLSPAGAWNALFSLVVPFAGVLLFASLELNDRRHLLYAWIAVACVSAVLGIGQLLGDPLGPLYIYEVTNRGMPVGLFANANHQAVFLATSIPLAALIVLSARDSGIRRYIAAVGLSLVFFAVALVTLSRAGVALSLIGFALAALVVHRNWRERAVTGGETGLPKLLRSPYVVPACLLLGLILSASLLFALRESPAWLAMTSSAEEVRLRAFPVVLEMVQVFWSVGAGGGSFEAAYKIFEPSSLLSPYYLNHAHNDWLEVVIEYGVPGALLVGALILFAVRGAARACSVAGLAAFARLAMIAPILFFTLASIVDYPLRVPLIQVFLACWLVGLNARPRSLLFRAAGGGSTTRRFTVAGQFVRSDT